MKKYKFTLTMMLLISANAIASEQRISFKECNYLSSQLNTNLPKRVDEITVTNSTTCTHRKDNRIAILYNTQIDIENKEHTKQILKKLHDNQKNNICTNPTLKSLIEVIDMGYVFNDSSGVYLGEFIVKAEDCI